MFKLLGIAAAIHAVQDAIHTQRQRQELTDQQNSLLEKISEKNEEIWALIKEYEEELEA